MSQKITPKVTAEEARAAYHAIIENADKLTAFLNEHFRDLQKLRPIELGRAEARLGDMRSAAVWLQEPLLRCCYHIDHESKIAKVRAFVAKNKARAHG